MKHLPLFFDLVGRRVVVVGAGPSADRRFEFARSAGADVRRMAPETVRVADFTGAAAAFVATGTADLDAATQRLAKAAGVPVNVADRPALCDFILPAIIDRDDVVVAVSTGGLSPTLATVLRGRIEAILPDRLGAIGRLVATYRAQARALVVDPGRRRAFFRRLVEGPAARLVLAGDDSGARRVALGELDAARRRMIPTGIAHIVGAGPGDPDLLTLRAAQLLQEADAILHDELVPSAVLARGRRDAELVAVGKRKGRTGWSQDDIDAELVRRVRAGQVVVRLKAGDPFVFGRGGEEVDALRAAGLAYTIVPGITAALGCAAAVGIPLTHRRIASAVTFVSGHDADVDTEGAGKSVWPAAFASGAHTLAIYMGATEAASVRDRLLSAGANPATPVALIENGTRPSQRVSTGRLGDLTRIAAPHAAGSEAGPSLIIVGDVAAYAAEARRPQFAEVS